ncbi:YetF domain-containing protein [Piscinibacter sp. XHJ-5]|uniref:DUF421 domain-containing protein n=1 Tax=Piscinibacter sp. XHJ-5 TaxID=3037797 RepID=UPI002452E265|nr:YetF domain-containing protein [Piscinibacter sp. XHJ-5]
MDTVLRVATIYLIVFAALRVMGKREFGQLSPLELVTLLMIPEIVSQALTGEDYSVTNAAIGVATLLVLVFGTSLLMHRFKKAEAVIAGESSILVRHGKLLEDAMNVARVTADEVFGEMHKAGLVTLDQVDWAILEPDGRIAIVPVRKPGDPIGQITPVDEEKVVGG